MRHGTATAATLLVGLVPFPAVAHAGVAAAAQIDFPSTVTVGQTGIPATLTLTNLNDGPDSSAMNEVCNVGEASPPCVSPERGITLVPSCKQLTGTQCTAAGADPGVFALWGTGFGAFGSSCAGMSFTVTLIDPNLGTVRFTPPGGVRVTLPVSGSRCAIGFTFGVLKSPTADSSPAMLGNQTAQTAAHTQFQTPFGPGAPAIFTRVAANTTVLRAGPPSITTAASHDVYLGDRLTDDATVFPLVNAAAGATVTFRLYSPSAPTCTGLPVFSDTRPVKLTGTTATATSDAFIPSEAGVYRWIATYDGDANNLPVSGTCAEASETVVVKEPPAILTDASPDIVMGAGKLSDDAAVLGGSDHPSDATITFTLFGPDDPTCARTPAFSPAPVPYPVTGEVATSPPFAPPAAGTYRWIASYSGDADNPPAIGLCDDADERTVVARAAPTITTNASPDSVLGAATLLDDATVSGRVNPSRARRSTFASTAPMTRHAPARPCFARPRCPIRSKVVRCRRCCSLHPGRYLSLDRGVQRRRQQPADDRGVRRRRREDGCRSRDADDHDDRCAARGDRGRPADRYRRSGRARQPATGCDDRLPAVRTRGRGVLGQAGLRVAERRLRGGRWFGVVRGVLAGPRGDLPLADLLQRRCEQRPRGRRLQRRERERPRQRGGADAPDVPWQDRDDHPRRRQAGRHGHARSRRDRRW